MRKLSLFLLLASAAAAPSVAAMQDSDPRAERRAERRAAAEERAEARAQRADRPLRVERMERPERPQRAELMEHAERPQQAEQVAPVQGLGEVRQREGGFERLRERRLGRGNAVVTQEAQAGDALAPRQRRIRTIPETQPVVAQQGRAESRQDRRELRHERRADNRDGNYQRWTTHWRGDRRYDWRRYRDRNRSLFRIGFYYDPFGWSYRRWNIGWQMWPSHYSSRYWLNDPWHYRLPHAYGPYRWVRYWDDALLVNIYTGQVVDVIYNFFW